MTASSVDYETLVLQACMVVRDPSAFGLLIEDLNDHFGPAWGELNPAETKIFLTQPDGKRLNCLIIAVDEDDRLSLRAAQDVIAQAAELSMPVLVVTEDLSDAEIAALTGAGATAHLSYPLERGALSRTLGKIAPNTTQSLPVNAHVGSSMTCVVQGVAGGTGATTLAVTLADELAQMAPGKVCLLDLDLHFGSCDRSLGLRSGDKVADVLSGSTQFDLANFRAALQTRSKRLSVLTTPNTIMPFEQVNPAQIARLIEMARSQFEFVIIDMPNALTPWSADVLETADMVFCPIELDARSAQSAARFLRFVEDDNIEIDELWFAVNRLPKTADPTIDVHLTRLTDLLQAPIDLLLPDEGRPMTIAANRGRTLGEAMPTALYRLEIQALADNLLRLNRALEWAA